MSLEIERKWLLPFNVAALNGILNKVASVEHRPPRTIVQSYVAVGSDDSPSIRIRHISGRDRHDSKLQSNEYNLCLKFPTDSTLVRSEVEVPITKAQYADLYEQCGWSFTKVRHSFYDQYSYDIDIINTINAQLILVEVEFMSPAQAEAFVLPQWLADLSPSEVTDNPTYLNSVIAISHPRG